MTETKITEKATVNPIDTKEAHSGDKAATFCRIMRHKDAPTAFNALVITQLLEWKLLEPDEINPQDLDTYETYIQYLIKASQKAKMYQAAFKAAFANNPWSYDKSVEAQYTPAELASKFPTALALKKILNEDLTFLFRAEPARHYLRLIERESGKKQVLRVIQTERSIDEINSDAAKAPEILPRFEAVQLDQERVALLIDWVDGSVPANSEEAELCLSNVSELADVPMTEYDFYGGNFLITTDLSGTKRAKYVDQDIPVTIAQKGYSINDKNDRLQAIEAGKQRLILQS